MAQVRILPGARRQHPGIRANVARIGFDTVGIWSAGPTLDAGEKIAFSSAGNLFRLRRQISGRITVTDKRFLFVPSRLGKLVGGEPLDLRLDTVSALQLARPGRAAILQRGAGAARRHQVEITSGDRMVVVTVRDYDRLMAAISAARRQ